MYSVAKLNFSFILRVLVITVYLTLPYSSLFNNVVYLFNNKLRLSIYL
jgi:hypothetical protein